MRLVRRSPPSVLPSDACSIHSARSLVSQGRRKKKRSPVPPDADNQQPASWDPGPVWPSMVLDQSQHATFAPPRPWYAAPQRQWDDQPPPLLGAIEGHLALPPPYLEQNRFNMPGAPPGPPYGTWTTAGEQDAAALAEYEREMGALGDYVFGPASSSSQPPRANPPPPQQWPGPVMGSPPGPSSFMSRLERAEQRDAARLMGGDLPSISVSPAWPRPMREVHVQQHMRTGHEEAMGQVRRLKVSGHTTKRT